MARVSVLCDILFVSTFGIFIVELHRLLTINYTIGFPKPLDSYESVYDSNSLLLLV